ncbi:EAL domain-containing protein [Gimesia sp.]|uniref:two-component system response regulator n=1 Tax=Gimesia sp. TaxID=2024833 RepID=UPI003A8CB5C9
MQNINEISNRRILVIDDNQDIQNDFRKILAENEHHNSSKSSYSGLFGEEPQSDIPQLSFEVDTASQGQEGLEKVRQSLQKQRPYAMAFVDIRMPPGWDGVQTVGHLWEADPNLLIVICTAYNDYNWSEMTRTLGHMNRWLILKKPFDIVEVRQLAASLTQKWELARRAEFKVHELQKSLGSTNRKLEAYNKAVDAAGIVAVLDPRGRILEANDNFCKISGYTKEELVGQSHEMIHSEHHPVEFFEELYATIKQNNIWRGEICNRAKDGSLYWVDTTIVPMLDEYDNTVSYYSFRIEITDRKRLISDLCIQAYHDSLTGLPNRAYILDLIQSSIDQKPDHFFALLFLDFDRFKLINDSLGHEMGDQLLIEISQRLSSTLREADQVKPARLGGDEFVVLLNNITNLSNATRVAERLLEKLSQSYQLGSHTVYSSVSIGIVTSDFQYESANDMLRDADLAMYKAKASNAGSYMVFDQSMREQVQFRLQIESDLRLAIEQNEFQLYYQPIVSLESGKIDGVEALLRWEHPLHGMTGPDIFIPIAEETGLINSIGKWGLNQACQQFSTWRQTQGDYAPSILHVNLSRKQLLDPDLTDFVLQTIRKHDLPPDCLHLEVTESLIMQDQVNIIEILRKLRTAGIKIDMDDFGTGYSSLSCLHEFPLDVLKIDRSLIMNVKHVHDYAALLQSVLALADNLGLKVVAEGIEDTEQLIILQALGCEYGQGYLFSRPRPAEEIETLFYSEAPWIQALDAIPVNATIQN